MQIRQEKEVRLREFFNSNYKLITALPAWHSFTYYEDLDPYIDDIIFSRYKDILVDPERFLWALDSWFYARRPDFEKMYKALVLKEYDPLSNYDMIEKEGSISKEGEKTSEAKRYGTEESSMTIPTTKSSRYSTTYDNAAEGRLESYTIEEPDVAPTVEGQYAQISRSQQLADQQGKQGTELTEKYKGDVTITAPESELEGDRGQQRELTRKGNIGVTTSQQMLESEITLRDKYNFINYFCNIFVRECTIGVYDI